MKRALILTAFGLLTAISFFATRGDAQPNTVKQIVPGVWFREGDIVHEGHCNNVIIEMKDYLIVVDANFPSGARAVMEDLKKISSKPVKYVFDTHHHGDHAYGNPVWTKAGATTLAYIGVAQEMKRYEPARWQESAKQRKDVGELNLDAPEPPKETFSKTPYVLNDDSRRVEIYFFGWAHTRGDGFVYLPKEKVLCTGDAVIKWSLQQHGGRESRQLARRDRKGAKTFCRTRAPGPWTRRRKRSAHRAEAFLRRTELGCGACVEG